MQKVLEKLSVARVHIKSHPLKKDGTNTFSKYDYFTPELVGKMVTDACIEANIICVFNLKKDDLGYYGELITTDLESGESLTSIMRTEKPVITATNETQQMGGMNTYTKRYCLMSLFDIEDNTIDFDSQDNTKRQDKQIDSELPWLNKVKKDGMLTDEWNKVVSALKTGKYTIADVQKKYKLSKVIKTELEGVKP